MFRASRVLSLIVPLAVLALGARPAAACTPPPGGLPEYGICDRASVADVVLVGVAAAVHNQPNPPYSVEVQVEEYLKATGPVTVTIMGFGPSSLCMVDVRVDDRRIFFANGDPERDATLVASYRSQFDAVQPASPENIAALRAGCVAIATSTPDPNPPPEVVGQLWLPRLLVRALHHPRSRTQFQENRDNRAPI